MLPPLPRHFLIDGNAWYLGDDRTIGDFRHDLYVRATSANPPNGIDLSTLAEFITAVLREPDSRTLGELRGGSAADWLEDFLTRIGAVD